jgi:hypothetical protein
MVSSDGNRTRHRAAGSDPTTAPQTPLSLHILNKHLNHFQCKYFYLMKYPHFTQICLLQLNCFNT